MTAPTDRAIDVRALAEQAGAREYHVNRSLVPFDGQALVGDEITRFARLVLEEAAKVCEDRRQEGMFWGEPLMLRGFKVGAWECAAAIRRLAPEEGKP